jgi:hypothetical protein
MEEPLRPRSVTGGNHARTFIVDAGTEVPPDVQTSSSTRSVPANARIHLAAELGVHEDNVTNGQYHAEAPPD